VKRIAKAWTEGSKKFAPAKGVRRRAAPAPAPQTTAPSSTSSATPAPSVDQTPQPEPEPSSAPTPAVQLPTPTATQDQPEHDAPEPTPTSTESTTSAPASTSHDVAPTVSEPLPTPTEADPESESRSRPTEEPTQDAHDVAGTESARKRRRTDPPASKSTANANTVAESSSVEASAVIESEATSEPQPNTTLVGSEQAVADAEHTATAVGGAEERGVPDSEAARPRKRRTLPWNAVNRPQEVVEEEEAPVPAKRPRKPPKPRGKKKAANVDETQEGEQQEVADGSEAPPVQKMPSAKARAKRRADAPVVEEGEDASAPAKKARRARKVKSRATVTDADADDDVGAQQQAEESQEVVVRRKPRQPRQPRKKKQKTVTEGEAEDGQDPSQPKRRGRPPREPTPSDAEDNEIDPDDTYMDTLASRNIRVGRLSNRERQMRDVDWDEVRRKRREEDTRPITTKELREKADALLAAQQSTTEMPQIRVGADGTIGLVHASTTIDRYADADRERETYVVQEERPITSRITSRSFLKNNKRFPNDFLLPGQGKKWTADDTDRFYQGLRNFGTDFQMISQMFPHCTRRSIKLKFTREERENPDAVRDALLGASEIVQNWDDFIHASEMTEEGLANTDNILAEMAAEEARMRVLIDKAKEEKLERDRQRRDAGLIDELGNELDGEGNKVEVGGKENGKGRKKGKGKVVAFREEVGVEILGGVDEDPGWGVVE